jgi:hypothetical protein
LYIALGKREKEKKLLERVDNIKTYKHRKPTRDEVEDMTQCSKAFTKKEMKKVFNPFFFQPKRK